jgi:hypothetical protein
MRSAFDYGAGLNLFDNFPYLDIRWKSGTTQMNFGVVPYDVLMSNLSNTDDYESDRLGAGFTTQQIQQHLTALQNAPAVKLLVNDRGNLVVTDTIVPTVSKRWLGVGIGAETTDDYAENLELFLRRAYYEGVIIMNTNTFATLVLRDTNAATIDRVGEIFAECTGAVYLGFGTDTTAQPRRRNLYEVILWGCGSNSFDIASAASCNARVLFFEWGITKKSLPISFISWSDLAKFEGPRSGWTGNALAIFQSDTNYLSPDPTADIRIIAGRSGNMQTDSTNYLTRNVLSVAAMKEAEWWTANQSLMEFLTKASYADVDAFIDANLSAVPSTDGARIHLGDWLLIAPYTIQGLSIEIPLSDEWTVESAEHAIIHPTSDRLYSRHSLEFAADIYEQLIEIKGDEEGVYAAQRSAIQATSSEIYAVHYRDQQNWGIDVQSSLMGQHYNDMCAAAERENDLPSKAVMDIDYATVNSLCQGRADMTIAYVDVGGIYTPRVLQGVELVVSDPTSYLVTVTLTKVDDVVQSISAVANHINHGVDIPLDQDDIRRVLFADVPYVVSGGSADELVDFMFTNVSNVASFTTFVSSQQTGLPLLTPGVFIYDLDELTIASYPDIMELDQLEQEKAFILFAGLDLGSIMALARVSMALCPQE